MVAFVGREELKIAGKKWGQNQARVKNTERVRAIVLDVRHVVRAWQRDPADVNRAWGRIASTDQHDGHTHTHQAGHDGHTHTHQAGHVVHMLMARARLTGSTTAG